MKINLVVGMIIFRKIRGAGGNPPTWHLWEVTSFDSNKITMQGPYRDEMDTEDFQGEVDTGDIYVSFHDEYEAVKERIKSLEIELTGAKSQIPEDCIVAEVLASNSTAECSIITVKVTTERNDRMIPAAGAMVQVW
jgi:hypothetical protein